MLIMTIKKFSLILLSTVMFGILVFEIQSSWTKFPEIKLNIEVGSKEDILIRESSIKNFLGPWGTFAYFTEWSNILFVVPFTLANVFNLQIKRSVKFVFMTYLTVTFFVFWGALAPFAPWGQSAALDFNLSYEHAIPFTVCALWLYWTPSKEPIPYAFKELLIFPTLYLIFILIFTAAVKGEVAVYPFINFTDWFARGYGSAMSTALSTVVILIICFVLIGTYMGLVKIYNLARIKKTKEILKKII